VITNKDIKSQIYSEAARCKKYLFEKSGWKWLSRYEIDFIEDVPVIIAVIGDPKKTGVDMFLEGGGSGYQDGCAVSIQNMLLTAHALGLGSLWFTIFQKTNIKNILNIELDKNLVALILIGKPSTNIISTPRISIKDKTRYMR
jgi:nitroreductase